MRTGERKRPALVGFVKRERRYTCSQVANLARPRPRLGTSEPVRLCLHMRRAACLTGKAAESSIAAAISTTPNMVGDKWSSDG